MLSMPSLQANSSVKDVGQSSSEKKSVTGDEKEKLVKKQKTPSILYNKGMQDDVFLHQSMIDQSMLDSRMVSVVVELAGT